MIPGQILLRATILALACSMGAALVSASSGPAAQDHPKATATNSEHKYTPLSNWVACAVISVRGYDGWTSQGGAAWKCDDGATVYDVLDEFTSARAAKAERMARLEEKGPKHKPWRIARTEPLGDATIVEFTEPVSVGTKDDASNQWAVMWARKATLLSIYGPDREHVIDYYQTRHGGDAKK